MNTIQLLPSDDMNIDNCQQGDGCGSFNVLKNTIAEPDCSIPSPQAL
jgi:hypothetical protein